MGLSEGMEFEFDGRRGSELGLYIIHDDGLFTRQFGLVRDTHTEQIRGNDLPYHYYNENNVLSGSIMLYSEEPWTLKQQRAVAEFLFRDTYKDLISEDNPDILYSLIFKGEPTLSTGIGGYGYLSVDYECDAPWAWSKPLVAEYPLTPAELYSGFIFEMDNISNYKDYNAVEMQIDFINTRRNMNGSASVIDMVCPNSKRIEIRNLKNQEGGHGFIVRGTDKHPLINDERIYINMGLGRVMSNCDEFRFNTCNQNWIRLERGRNKIKISMNETSTGAPSNYRDTVCFTLTTRTKFPILK